MNRNWTVLHKAELVDAHGNVCVNCGSPDIEWHHIVPISKGGTDSVSNVIPLCHKCHGNSHGQLWGCARNGGGRQKKKYDEYPSFRDFLDYVFKLTDLEARERIGAKQNRRSAMELFGEDNKRCLRDLFGIGRFRRLSNSAGRIGVHLYLINGCDIFVPASCDTNKVCGWLGLMFAPEWLHPQMKTLIGARKEEIT